MQSTNARQFKPGKAIKNKRTGETATIVTVTENYIIAQQRTKNSTQFTIDKEQFNQWQTYNR